MVFVCVVIGYAYRLSMLFPHHSWPVALVASLELPLEVMVVSCNNWLRAVCFNCRDSSGTSNDSMSGISDFSGPLSFKSIETSFENLDFSPSSSETSTRSYVSSSTPVSKNYTISCPAKELSNFGQLMVTFRTSVVFKFTFGWWIFIYYTLCS